MYLQMKQRQINQADGDFMKRHAIHRSLWFFLCICAFLILSSFLAGCARDDMATGTMQKGKSDGMPAGIEGKNLKRGLKAIYLYDKYKNISDMPTTERGIAKFGRPAPPILQLDHEFHKGNVFESGRSTEIGVLMTGYLHLDKPGEYVFQAKSNDGFQLIIDGDLVVSDPGVHGDRLSDPGRFFVKQGGMFPVEIRYFQRKGTATVKLYWQIPGTNSFSIVPSVAYLHSSN